MRSHQMADNKLLDLFEEFLIDCGYSQVTPSGLPSTVPQYIHAIKKVCDAEHVSLITLPKCIDQIVKKYDVGGEKELVGKQGHSTVINALKRYAEFIKALSEQLKKDA